MNIYEMYYENDKQFGFWIKRNYWANTIAKVISIEGVIEGGEIGGSKPYHGNPKVIAEFYNQSEKENCHSGNLEHVTEVSCPGTFGYSML
jgi:hypothetical protein